MKDLWMVYFVDTEYYQPHIIGIFDTLKQADEVKERSKYKYGDYTFVHYYKLNEEREYNEWQ